MRSNEIAVMRQALEALEDVFGKNKVDVSAINALRAALSEEAMQRLTDVQQEMEPVAMRAPKENDRVICIEDESLGTVRFTSAAGGPCVSQ